MFKTEAELIKLCELAESSALGVQGASFQFGYNGGQAAIIQGLREYMVRERELRKQGAELIRGAYREGWNRAKQPEAISCLNDFVESEARMAAGNFQEAR